MRAASALLLVALVVGPVRADDAAPLAPAPLLDRLTRAAVDLARRGRRAEAEELIDVAAELRAPAAEVAAAKDAVAKALAKAKAAAPPFPDVAKTLTKLATDLAATLPAAEGDAKTRLARQTLRIDGANRAAHEAAGDVERGGAWISSVVAPLLPRRAEIQEALRAARRIDVTVEPTAPDSIVAKVHGRPGAAVACGPMSMHSATLGAERMTRQLREVARAMALVQWLLGGKLEVPKGLPPYRLLVFERKADYVRAMAEAQATGRFPRQDLDPALLTQSQQHGPLRILESPAESSAGAWAFLDQFRDHVLEADVKRLIPIRAGFTNWTCARYLGCPSPVVVWHEVEAKKRDGSTSDVARDDAERRAARRFASAGFAGLRLWMKWLARRGEDPAWSRSMVDQFGKVGGDDLAKCTFVVDYLAETRELAKVMRAAWNAPPGPAGVEKALGRPLGEFEHRWREWLLADEPIAGLVQRLGPPTAETLSAVEASCLAHLDATRRRTLGKDAPAVGLDRELSEGCRAHAVYLDKHPAQKSAWPDAHEEYADQEGFSPEGGRAGLSSVIAPGAAGPEAAIDSWMATFYHRLPLLAPGLVRIGWGFEKGVAVLDAASLVAPPERAVWVAWPAAGGKDVPRRFAPELPSPVEGEDQSAWGYPVTLQFFSCPVDPDVRMTLCVGGKRGGAEVPCHFSTPNAPTNDKLAPAGAFCLIPKQTLAPNAAYTVAVDGWPEDAKGADWTFTTGK